MNDHPEDRPSPTFTSAREAALDEQASMDDWHDEWENFDDDEGESK